MSYTYNFLIATDHEVFFSVEGDNSFKSIGERHNVGRADVRSIGFVHKDVPGVVYGPQSSSDGPYDPELLTKLLPKYRVLGHGQRPGYLVALGLM